MEFSRQGYWYGLPSPSLEDLPDTGTEPTTPMSPALAVGLFTSAAAAAESLQSCPTLCDPIDRSPRGSPAPEILQERVLEWVSMQSMHESGWYVTREGFPGSSDRKASACNAGDPG